MQIVPLNPVPSQSLNITLGGQACQINVYQKAFGVFLDLSVNNVLIIGGVLCLNLVLIVRSLYLGFVGDLAFIDNQDSSDPTFDGLGSRYSLAYLTTDDVALIPNLSPGEG